MSTEPVLILKGVKVICFHTLLQVLILKVVVAVFCDLRKMRSLRGSGQAGQAPRGSGNQTRVPRSRRVNWICLILKDLTFLVATKSPQENEGKGDSWWREVGIASTFARSALDKTS